MTLQNISLTTLPTSRLVVLDDSNNQIDPIAAPNLAVAVAILRYIPAEVPVTIPGKVYTNLGGVPATRYLEHTVQTNLTGINFCNIYAKKLAEDTYFKVAEKVTAGAELSFALLSADFVYGDNIIVRVEDFDNPAIDDVRSGTIGYDLTITSPTAGEDITRTSVFNVTGNTNLDFVVVEIYDGTDWIDIGAGAHAGGAFDIECTVPAGFTLGSTNLRVRRQSNVNAVESVAVNVISE